MSRSKRKVKIFGNCGHSEKQDKRRANRAFRRKQRVAIHKEDFEKLPIDLEEVASIWSMSKDGKSYWEDASEKDMRK